MPTQRPKLSHTDTQGQAHMVNVGEKPITARSATAEATVRISAALAKAIKQNQLKKGNLLEVAKLAGILAAKRTDELIPLCHSLPLDSVDVQATLKTVDQARESLRLATARFNAGTATQLDVLSSQVALSQARLNELQANYNYNVALAGMRKAIGQGDVYAPVN